jgi:DNA-binding transcriptional ArsR family regulator
MGKLLQKKTTVSLADPDQNFEVAAELFRILSAPMRLRIIKSLCEREKNVSELLSTIDTTQPNMSQHLNMLYLSGVLGKRREGVQIYYRITDERVAKLCRVVCAQVTTKGDFAIE